MPTKSIVIGREGKSRAASGDGRLRAPNANKTTRFDQLDLQPSQLIHDVSFAKLGARGWVWTIEWRSNDSQIIASENWSKFNPRA